MIKNKRIYLPIAFTFLALLMYVFSAVNNFSVIDQANPNRQMRLFNIVLCPVCKGQTVAESDVKVAILIRKQIEEQISQGKSDKQIIQFLTEIYGPEIIKSSSANYYISFLLIFMLGLIVAKVKF